MNKLKAIILSILSGIGALFSAIFYVLYKQKKEEALIEKNKTLDAENKLITDIHNADVTIRKNKENEINEIISSSGADTVRIANDIVHNLASKKRN